MAPKDFLAELAGLSQTPNLNTVEVKKQNLEQTSANKKAALGGISPAAAAIVDTVDGNHTSTITATPSVFGKTLFFNADVLTNKVSINSSLLSK